jgi:selenium-binding protein 1
MIRTLGQHAITWTLAIAAAVALVGTPIAARADETCQSPYMPKITGEEEYVYVWTLGVEGLGDGSDKLVTVDARKGSPTHGQVIHSVSVGGRHEAHHADFTDDRRFLWASGLDTSQIFVFDVATDPAKPRLVKTIDDFVQASGGVVGPHGFYALPGRMLVGGLSNIKDKTGRTATDADPRGAVIEKVADGYGYDARVLPRKNVMFTTSFTGWSNYMMDFGQMLKDETAMKRFGQTAAVWNFHTRQPKKVFHVPGAPLEVRVAWGPTHNYAFTTTALTSQIWLIYEDAQGEWQAKAVGDIGDPKKIPLPVDISLSADDRTLWVDSFMDGMVRAYDVSDPFKPKQFYEKKIGRQLNMVSQSWDGKRLYFTSSLIAKWDKQGADNEQFLRAYTWDGTELRDRFALDFTQLKLGRPHVMRFGSAALYK